jgi:hypothetical protein
MAKKKTQEEIEEKQSYIVVTFVGGTRDGMNMKVAKQLLETMRFGFPVWETYELRPNRIYELVSN